MIAFDLKCRHTHVFEAWFRSSDDYVQQRDAALISCPICHDTGVSKAVMAPNVGAKTNRSATVAPVQRAHATPVRAQAATGGGFGDVPMAPAQLITRLAEVQARTIAQSTWVGPQFATQCRAMHDGDIAPAMIHGQASRDEAVALIEDGIGVMPLVIPIVPPELQN